MEHCTFCDRVVIDDSGAQTQDFGTVRNNRYICSRCMRAFEFSLGS
ncbi:hypothetical protein [Nitrososphaera sp.]